MPDHFKLRDQVIREITVAPGWNKEDAERLVDDLLEAHENHMGLGEVPRGKYETVCGMVVPDGIEARISTIGSQFLAIHGDWPAVMGFIASMLHHMDWILETNYKPDKRLEVQRRIDAALDKEW